MSLSSEREIKEIVIRPPKRLPTLDVMELYRYRGLLKSMVVRQVKLEFSETYLSYFWAVARPLLMVAVFTLLRNLSQAQTEVTIPYPLYLLSGLILWFYFTEAVSDTSNAVRSDLGLIRKIFYPRLLSPMAAVLSNLSKLAVASVPIVLMMLYYGVVPGWQLLLLPAVLLQCVLLILGVGSMFAALTLTRRDWEKFLGLILYIGLFISPVIYAPEMIPEKARIMYSSNPMVGTLLGFRSAICAEMPFPWAEWFYSLAFSVVMVAVGLAMFQRAEKRFVDEL